MLLIVQRKLGSALNVQFLGDIIYTGLGKGLPGFRLSESGTNKGNVYTLSVSQSMSFT